jgi:hypothetical protein
MPQSSIHRVGRGSTAPFLMLAAYQDANAAKMGFAAYELRKVPKPTLAVLPVGCAVIRNLGKMHITHEQGQDMRFARLEDKVDRISSDLGLLSRLLLAERGPGSGPDRSREASRAAARDAHCELRPVRN